MVLRPSPLPIILGLILLLPLLSTPASARTYHFHHYNELDGIPGSAVHHGVQDSLGRLWFATRTGVGRYDGQDWVAYGVEDGLAGSEQQAMAIDHQGRIYALSIRTPIHITTFENDRWVPLPVHPIGLGVTVDLACGKSPAGQVLLAVTTTADEIHVWDGHRWRTILLEDPEIRLHSVVWQGDRLHVASDRGLHVVSGFEAEVVVQRIESVGMRPVYAALPQGDHGALQLVGEGWIGTFSGEDFTIEERLPALSLIIPERGVTAVHDHLGGLYVGDVHNLFYHHPLLGLEQVDKSNGLLGNGVTEILADRGGQVWMMNMRGVSKLVSRRFTSYTRATGLLDDEVSAVLERRDGTMVLGHEGGLTIMSDPPRHLPTVPKVDSWIRANCMVEAGDGTIWAAMGEAGLAAIDTRDEIQWFATSETEKEHMNAVVLDGRGRLWVGTSLGVYRRDGDSFTPIKIRSGEDVRQPPVRRLVVLDDGALYVATSSNGIFRITETAITQMEATRGSLLNSAYTVFDAPDGSIWVATAAGLGVIEGDRIVPLGEAGPVIDRPIYAVADDGRGSIWFGTDAGVYVWDGDKLQQFNVREGLVGSEINRDAFKFDRLGRLWIGTDRGVSIHDDRLVDQSENELGIWIEALQTNAVRHPADRTLELPPGPGELVIHFRSASFLDERRLRFRTFLEGFDSDWSEPEMRPFQSIRYTNLPPGSYTFHVQAVDLFGRTSGIASSQPIEVQAPFHEAVWFKLLGIALITGLLLLIATAVQGRKYAGRLEAEVIARTAALADSEQAVRAESQRLGAVLESISDGVLAVDGKGRIVLGNAAAELILSQEPGSLPGRDLEALLPGIAVMTGPHFGYQFTLPGEASRSLEFSLAPLAGAAGSGMVLAFRDVTYRLRAENERIRTQKLESLGVLAGGLAHDFNNLLTVVLGHVSVLETGAGLGIEDLRSLASIRSATQRAQGLTTQLLTFARGGAPRKELTDVGQLIKESTQLSLSGTTVSCDLDLADDLNHADLDAAQFGQVLSNMLINAHQAMPEGGKVTVSACNVGTVIEIKIADDGPGMTGAELERIFEPYYSTKETGSGLGLSIAYSVVTRHGGDLTVQSEPGQGTEFTIRVPASLERVEAEPEEEPVTSNGSGRFLVLDDEPSVRELLQRMLERLGYEAEGVEDGAQAIERYQEALASNRPYSVVIMDLTIPGGMGGKDAIEQLQAMDPGVRGIVASGYSNDPVMSDPTAFGFVGALHKPFDKNQLSQVITAVLG